MSKKNSPPTDTTTSDASLEKTVQEETLAESARRVGNMIIENLKNRENHADYREYPKDKE